MDFHFHYFMFLVRVAVLNVWMATVPPIKVWMKFIIIFYSWDIIDRIFFVSYVELDIIRLRALWLFGMNLYYISSYLVQP